MSSALPFDRSHPSIYLVAKASLLPDSLWGVKLNAAADPPISPVEKPQSPIVDIQLVPYGIYIVFIYIYINSVVTLYIYYYL
jgi:hypothetical protein